MDQIISVYMGFDHDFDPPEYRIFVASQNGLKSYPAVDENMISFHQWHIETLKMKMSNQARNQVEFKTDLNVAGRRESKKGESSKIHPQKKN